MQACVSLNLNQHYQNTNNEFNKFIFKTLQKNCVLHVITFNDQIITAINCWYSKSKLWYDLNDLSKNRLVIFQRHWFIGKINSMRYQEQALSLLSDGTKKWVIWVEFLLFHGISDNVVQTIKSFRHLYMVLNIAKALSVCWYKPSN